MSLSAQTTSAAIRPRFEATRLTSYRDSFALVLNGEQRGSHVYTLRRQDGGFVYTESVNMPGFLARDLTVELDADLGVTRASSSGQMQGQPMGSEMRYQGRHAKGWVLVQGPNGAQRVEWDTLLAAEAFDGLALMALLPALEWRPGAAYTLRLFDTDEGSTTDQMLRIVGPERVRVPAGEFDTFRADLTTTQAPVRIWLTQTQPHRLVKIGGDGDAFAGVLVRQGE